MRYSFRTGSTPVKIVFLAHALNLGSSFRTRVSFTANRYHQPRQSVRYPLKVV